MGNCLSDAFENKPCQESFHLKREESKNPGHCFPLMLREFKRSFFK